jgi:hypothetical protein
MKITIMVITYYLYTHIHTHIHRVSKWLVNWFIFSIVQLNYFLNKFLKKIGCNQNLRNQQCLFKSVFRKQWVNQPYWCDRIRLVIQRKSFLFHDLLVETSVLKILWLKKLFCYIILFIYVWKFSKKHHSQIVSSLFSLGVC